MCCHETSKQPPSAWGPQRQRRSWESRLQLKRFAYVAVAAVLWELDSMFASKEEHKDDPEGFSQHTTCFHWTSDSVCEDFGNTPRRARFIYLWCDRMHFHYPLQTLNFRNEAHYWEQIKAKSHSNTWDTGILLRRSKLLFFFYCATALFRADRCVACIWPEEPVYISWGSIMNR